MAKGCSSVVGVRQPLTKIEAEKEKKEHEEWLQKRNEKSQRYSNVVDAMRAVKSRMREPDSLRWAEIYANADGSLICMLYRAKNGFGGVNLETATVANNTVFEGSESRTKYCSSAVLYDMKNEVDI